MSLQYVVYDYWEYGYAEGDAILEFGSASVTSQATVTSDGIRIRTSSGSITGNANVSAFGTRIQFSNASIDANAVLTADGTRVRTSSGTIDGSATVSALGGVVYSANASVNSVASISAYPNAVWGAYAAVNANAIFIAKGNIIGEDWIDTAPSVNAWNPITIISNDWTPIVNGLTNWANQKIQDPYVEIDYWVDGYTDDRYDYWIKTSSVQDNWTRQ